MPLNDAERRLRAQIAANERWSRTTAAERRDATEAARTAWFTRWERQVDPEGRLNPADRVEAAERAMKAHMARMQMRRSAARRRSTKSA